MWGARRATTIALFRIRYTGKASQQEKLLSDIKAENSELRITNVEALKNYRSMQEKLDTHNKVVSN